ncbi:MAG: YbhB/YbcL family Raf kinase inhibitor-like protein [Burkholderiales bacterium]|jgi:Raf kinase inhibitor-like YbhB/YbcL family protein|nr:YbhB/YbcL family Raf kinase inhibitor-like protein [Burkholderiales bacterium]
MKKSRMMLCYFSFFCFFALAGGAQAALTVTSTTFTGGGEISESMMYRSLPQCKVGDNKSPQLSWSGAPTGTTHFAVVAVDTSEGYFLHWGVLNIPASVTSLAEAADTSSYDDMINGSLGTGYFGFCPRPDQRHQYTFTVYALNAALPDTASIADIEAAAEAFELLETVGKGNARGSISGFRLGGPSRSVPALGGLGLLMLSGLTAGCAFWARKRGKS